MSAQNAPAAAPPKGFGSRGRPRRIGTDRGAVRHAQMYQAVSARRTATREMFVNTLGTSAGSYAATEAANAIAAG
jgi:hypothetical protein